MHAALCSAVLVLCCAVRCAVPCCALLCAVLCAVLGATPARARLAVHTTSQPSGVCRGVQIAGDERGGRHSLAVATKIKTAMAIAVIAHPIRALRAVVYGLVQQHLSRPFCRPQPN